MRCRLTIRLTPSASEMVTTAGSASGTTATASATPKISISMKGWPRNRPRATMMMTSTNATRASALPTRSRFSCNGVLPGLDRLRACARSCRTRCSCPWRRRPRARAHRSPACPHRPCSCGRRWAVARLRAGVVCFSTGADSPVSAASIRLQVDGFDQPCVGGHFVAGRQDE